MYKCIIPIEVEEKIRILCASNPHKEWSGVLFTEIKGSFEENLEVVCVDLLPLNIGSHSYTEFEYSSDIANYIAENPELLVCDMHLIHSHNDFASFFSGTDMNTLNSEGKESTHFVSLIVNNEGKYVAKITRKVSTKIIGKKVQFYTTHNNKEVVLSEEEGEFIIDKDKVEGIDLEIEKEEVSTSWYDKVLKLQSTFSKTSTLFSKNYTSNPSYPSPPTTYKDSLFEEDVNYPTHLVEDIDREYNSINDTEIENICNKVLLQLFTLSILSINNNINIESIIKGLKSNLDKRFNGDTKQYIYYADVILDLLLEEYDRDNTKWVEILTTVSSKIEEYAKKYNNNYLKELHIKINKTFR